MNLAGELAVNGGGIGLIILVAITLIFAGSSGGRGR